MQPAYIDILRQLTPIDVAVLKDFYEAPSNLIVGTFVTHYEEDEPHDRLGISMKIYDISKNKLLRLRLVQEQLSTTAGRAFLGRTRNSVYAMGIDETSLGRAFVTACGLNAAIPSRIKL